MLLASVLCPFNQLAISNYSVAISTLYIILLIDNSIFPPPPSADMDYTAVTAALTFQNPVTAQCVNISTIEDPDSMDDVQFTVMLSTSESSTAVSLSPNETTVSIRNSTSIIVIVGTMHTCTCTVNMCTCI